MAIVANSSNLTQQVPSRQLRGIGCITYGPLSSQWISIKKSRRCFQKDSSCLVETERFPEASIDALARRDPATGEVAWEALR